jgi:transcriptional regulator of acetoin/glycerol metabolism
MTRRSPDWGMARAPIEPWQETERKEILHAVKRSKGDLDLAAALLGISKQTIEKKLRNYPSTEVGHDKTRSSSC